jgi:hypothetical protein
MALDIYCGGSVVPFTVRTKVKAKARTRKR